jgi:adenosylcobinamide-phosphate synthase
VSVNARGRLSAIAIGLLGDRVFGEPPANVHPVAAFGRAMDAVEHRVYADSRARGLAYAATGAAIGVLAGSTARSTVAAVTATTAGRMLRDEARRIGEALERGDLEAARTRLPSLVGRDPDALDTSGIAAAVIESVAENSVDAVVGPVCWAAAFGAPGAAAYRAINTMDAMVGHHSPRYEQFGWAAARLDDIAGFVPARVTALLVCLATPARATNVLDTVRRDAPQHPSPNAGVAEAAFAAALGSELGGTLTYNGRVDERPRLGSGPRPLAGDISRAIKLADRVELLLVASLATAALMSRRSRR